MNRAEATSICRQQGMGDSNIQEVLSQLKGGGHVSLEHLEGLLRQFSQPPNREFKLNSETNSCGSQEATNGENTASSPIENGGVSPGEGASPNTNEPTSRGANFLELANTVSSLTLFIKY